MCQMGAFASGLLCIFLGLSLSFIQSEACMCDTAKHLQEHFCDADYVVKAKIIARRPIMGEHPRIPRAIRFTVKVLKSFKIPESENVIAENYVYTSASSCGVPFNIGKVYAIAGPVKKGEQWANVCNYATPWRELSPHMIKYLRGRYAKHCDCIGKMTTKPSKRYCYTSSAYWECFSKHSYCEVQPNKRCRWQITPPLTNCLRQKEP